jgi:[ribosomal protein S5]-alanine N-acetyltransferase
MPSFPELAQPLSDGLVTVRPAAERDIPEVLIAFQDDPELHLRTGDERPPSGAELGRRAERFEVDRLAGQGLTLTIVEPGEDICRGQINAHHLDWDNLRAELGLWIALGHRGRGLGQRALALVAGWLLRDGGLERVQVLIDPGNEVMLAAARAAGFSFEGVLRAHMRERGERVDVASLSLVRGDLTG